MIGLSAGHKGDAPVAHVVSLNLRRRYLDEGQREMIAARLAYLGPGRPSAHAGQSGQLAGLPPESPQIAQSAGAELLNVSERTVRAAKSMRERGVPELIEAAERGEIAVSYQPSNRLTRTRAGIPRLFKQMVPAARVSGYAVWYQPLQRFRASHRRRSARHSGLARPCRRGGIGRRPHRPRERPHLVGFN